MKTQSFSRSTVTSLNFNFRLLFSFYSEPTWAVNLVFEFRSSAFLDLNLWSSCFCFCSNYSSFEMISYFWSISSIFYFIYFSISSISVAYYCLVTLSAPFRVPLFVLLLRKVHLLFGSRNTRGTLILLLEGLWFRFASGGWEWGFWKWCG